MNYSQSPQLSFRAEPCTRIMPLSLHSQANFFVSVQELLSSSTGEESILDEKVRAMFQLGHYEQSVVPFLPHLPVFEVSHEMGRPVTLMTQDNLEKMLTDLNIKGRKSFAKELDLIKDRCKP